MNSILQLRQKNPGLSFDSGMELIWFLQDAYEEKDLEKFLSAVSSDFKKGFLKLETQLRKDFLENSRLNLYILLVSRDRDLNKDMCFYDICWSKRIKNKDDNYWQREFGKATIIVKRYNILGKNNFLVFDICGDNPFG